MSTELIPVVRKKVVTTLVRPLFARFLADDPEHFRLRRGKTHVIPNAEQHGLGRAAFLNDEGAALVLYPAQELAETCPRCERGYHNRVAAFSGLHGELFNSII